METALRTTENVAEANEWALVLASAGIPHRIESAETGWVLLVPDDEVARGQRALRAYAGHWGYDRVLVVTARGATVLDAAGSRIRMSAAEFSELKDG